MNSKLKEFAEIYDVKKIILFFSGIIIIIGLIIGLLIWFFTKKDSDDNRVNLSETSSNLEIASNNDAIPFKQEKCTEKINLKLHADITPYTTNIQGLSSEYGGYFVTAEITDLTGLVDYCKQRFGEEIAIDEISMPHNDNAIINKLNTETITHRWYIIGDQIPGAKGFETHEIFITEQSGQNNIYIII